MKKKINKNKSLSSPNNYAHSSKSGNLFFVNHVNNGQQHNKSKKIENRNNNTNSQSNSNIQKFFKKQSSTKNL